MNPTSIKQEVVDAKELAAALVAALGLPADHPSAHWAETAYQAVLDGQSCHPVKLVPAFDEIVGRPEDPETPLVLRTTGSSALLYLRHMDEMEDNLAKKVKGRATKRAEDARWDAAPANDIAAKDGLNDEQRSALYRIADYKFIILTGGPGTGKTHTLKSLLKYAVTVGKLSPDQIRLVAPTGRASRRIDVGLASLRQDEAFSNLPQPQTIHSLLYEPEAFDGMQLLVVDESSMVDLMLFDEVIAKLPDDCTLVLVGDPNQLPSVEVGSVLADLCESPILKPNIIQLVQQHRSKREIIELAERVLNDQGIGEIPLVEPTPDEVIKNVLPAFIKLRDMAHSGDVAGSVALIDEVRVLCSHVNGPLGAETLSRLIADKLDIRLNPLGTGSLVMVTRNDRRGSGLTNGDVGVMVGDLVYFPNNPVGYDISRLPGYALAFATTIHKAQGSEYKHAVVVISTSKREGFLNRQLIYTGITRAREQLTLIADRKILQEACENKVPRASGLKDRLS